MDADPDGKEGAGGGLEPAECRGIFGLIRLDDRNNLGKTVLDSFHTE